MRPALSHVCEGSHPGSKTTDRITNEHLREMSVSSPQAASIRDDRKRLGRQGHRLGAVSAE